MRWRGRAYIDVLNEMGLAWMHADDDACQGWWKSVSSIGDDVWV